MRVAAIESTLVRFGKIRPHLRIWSVGSLEFISVLSSALGPVLGRWLVPAG